MVFGILDGSAGPIVNDGGRAMRTTEPIVPRPESAQTEYANR